MRVVASGRYVELATDRDEPVCGGTIDFYDRFVEEAFAFIGEVPPDRVFLRYEWVGPFTDPVTGGALHTAGNTMASEDPIRIRSNVLAYEHELAHAIHVAAWPRSKPFLHEGFATFMDPTRRVCSNMFWPEGKPIDEVLEAPVSDGDAYCNGWFVVSQIIADHGTSGLGDFWRAVPPDASVEEIRAAYQSLFGRPIDALVEPWIYESDDPELDGEEAERGNCSFALCTGKPVPWEGEVWSASGPTGCETDPDAIGPDESEVGVRAPPVRRDYILDPAGPYYEPDPDNTLWAGLRFPCSLRCDRPTAYDYGQGPAPDEPWRHRELVRVQVHSELEDLPTDMPLQARFVRMPP